MKLTAKKFLSKSGFTLIEIMVAVGILGGLAVLVMRVFSMSVGSKKATQINETILQFSSQVMSFLDNKKNCSRILGGIKIDDGDLLATPATMPAGFIISTLNGNIIAEEQKFFNDNPSTELWIEDIWIDASLDDPTVTAKTYHMFKAELVFEIHRRPLGDESITVTGARKFIKRFPFLVDYSINRAFTMYLNRHTEETFAKDFILEQCKNIHYTDANFLGHEISKVFCHNQNDTLSHPQKACVGICRVRDLDDIRIAQCL
ncbi:type II secretion system GspH family protein [Bacteriovoracaceae bacterium]|nr:type II secretion system GspH family protein [Bacteriovoracaceae bacterium]